jgi:hypothetical protein
LISLLGCYEMDLKEAKEMTAVPLRSFLRKSIRRDRRKWVLFLYSSEQSSFQMTYGKRSSACDSRKQIANAILRERSFVGNSSDNSCNLIIIHTILRFFLSLSRLKRRRRI